MPDSDIDYTVRHLARADYVRRETTKDMFTLVLATAVPIIDEGYLKYRMQGNSKVANDGTFNIYDFDPLELHQFSAITARGDTSTFNNGSGIGLRRVEHSRGIHIILY
jgi:hypothetical protein